MSTKKPVTPKKTDQSAPDAPKVIGPGVVKRPKRAPTDAPASDENVAYVPSEQFFRRRG